jgi:flavodoxin
MKTLVIYDSGYGNTEKIAQSIGNAIGGDVKMLRIGDVKPDDLNAFDLLVIGSPTQGGRVTPAILAFLKNIPDSTIKEKKVAVFDTRMISKMVGIFGYAAGKLADSLKKRGAILIPSPEGFFVTTGKGSLKEGEIERAVSWAQQLPNGGK